MGFINATLHTHRHYQWQTRHNSSNVWADSQLCVYEQVIPASESWENDRPPTCSGSSYWCQFGVSGRAANGISLSAPQCSHHVSSPSSIALHTVKQGKTVKCIRCSTQNNAVFKTDTVQQILTHTKSRCWVARNNPTWHSTAPQPVPQCWVVLSNTSLECGYIFSNQDYRSFHF